METGTIRVPVQLSRPPPEIKTTVGSNKRKTIKANEGIEEVLSQKTNCSASEGHIPGPFTIHPPPPPVLLKANFVDTGLFSFSSLFSRLLKKSNPDPVKNNHHHANRQKRYREK
jgi:hypothetical protein